MPVKVFILGPPGSGKSTAGCTIRDSLLQRGRIRHIICLNDYDILRELFLAEQQAANPSIRRFRITKDGGFDIIDLTVFDEALRIANEKINLWLASEPDQWILVEFARDNYTQALRCFDSSVLQGAYLLFIDAQDELCRQRLHERVRRLDKDKMPDDHYVSDDILDRYYKLAAELNILDLRDEHGIEAHKVSIISNNGKREEFLEKIRLFVDGILQPA